jgi:hypothetical protein
LLAFRKAQRGQDKQGFEDRKPPPPRQSRNTRLRIASNMNFLPGP